MARTENSGTPLGVVVDIVQQIADGMRADARCLVVEVGADVLDDFKPGDELMLIKRESVALVAAVAE